MACGRWAALGLGDGDGGSDHRGVGGGVAHSLYSEESASGNHIAEAGSSLERVGWGQGVVDLLFSHFLKSHRRGGFLSAE